MTLRLCDRHGAPAVLALQSGIGAMGELGNFPEKLYFFLRRALQHRPPLWHQAHQLLRLRGQDLRFILIG